MVFSKFFKSIDEIVESYKERRVCFFQNISNKNNSKIYDKFLEEEVRIRGYAIANLNFH